ncbi:FRQ1, partial [Symbiodinium sp. CCMP2456]
MRASSLPTMILALCIAPYVGDLFNKQVAFIDMASIDQTDPVQKEQGISSIAGFLKKSDELQVMWSVDYLSRLWCVFELAAYRTANPSGKITLMPLFVEKTFAVLIVAVYGFTSVWVLAEAKFIPLGSEVWIFGVAFVPVGLSVHALRKSFLSKHQLLTALANFELENSTCSSEFDRRFILRCIRRWYGGPEQFESFVRKELREELLTQIRQTSFRSGYYLVTVVPSVCAGLDSLVCLWRGQAPTAALVTHFVCLVLAFDICWIVITFKLVLLLSDGSAQLCLGRFRFLDYAISLMIFVASGMIFMIGLVGSRLARNTLSVSTALGWLALSCILMALTSDCVWRQVLLALRSARSGRETLRRSATEAQPVPVASGVPVTKSAAYPPRPVAAPQVYYRPGTVAAPATVTYAAPAGTLGQPAAVRSVVTMAPTPVATSVTSAPLSVSTRTLGQVGVPQVATALPPGARIIRTSQPTVVPGAQVVPASATRPNTVGGPAYSQSAY